MLTSMPARRARVRLAFTLAIVGGVLTLAIPARATTTITLEPPTTPAIPGATFTFLVRISGVQAIAGYTLDLRVVPQAGATGTVAGNVAASNFYPAENLIAVGGGGLHSTYSTIAANGAGLKIDAIDQTFSATAVPGAGHDVLAEVAFDASPDTLGDFRFELGDQTLFVVNGSQTAPFESVLLTINIPEPASLSLLGGAAALLIRRRRRKMD